RLVTTLLDEKRYPASELIELYQQRWEVELMIRELKCVLHEQIKVLRSQTPEGVKQEMYGLMLAHYALRFWMVQAGERTGHDPRALSCVNAFEHLRRRIERVATRSLEDRELILTRMVQAIGDHVLPPPRLRSNRREIKQVYHKHKPKKRGTPAPRPFEKTDTYLTFVVPVVRDLAEQQESAQRSKVPSKPHPKSA
ncbi:transposase, partial [Dictyobacter formicarum]